MPIDWARWRNWWENTRDSLWFIPSLLTLLAIILSIALPAIDTRVADIGAHRSWLFQGSSSAARTILSVIAGSLITVISLLFSITMLTLQQASTQFTPRIFRNFTRDRVNQIVLGFYIATFVYAMLVLRQVRGDDALGGVFVPTLAMTAAILLALVCLGLLVYFIHHNATLFQASTIIERVHAELLEGIDKLYPAALGEPLPTANDELEDFRRRHGDGPTTTIDGVAAGYLRAIDDDAIIEALPDSAWAIIHPQVGWYVLAGRPLIEVGGVDGELGARADQLRDAFILDSERSPTQDTMFGVRQLADIGLKALSPAIHDPTTAEHAIFALGDALARLACRPAPSRERRVERHNGVAKRVELWVNRPDFDDHLDEAFAQIRRVASHDVRITSHLLGTLAVVASRLPDGGSAALRRQVEDIAWQIEHGAFSPDDRQRLLRRLTEAQEASERAPRVEA